MKSAHHSLLGLFVLLLLLSSCSDTAGNGSGTGTGNPIIVGTVTDSLGNPIANARIVVRPTDYLANNRNIDYLGEGTDEKGFAYTDQHGNYELEIKSIDNYYVEAITDDTQSGIVQSVNVTSLGSRDTFKVADAVIEVLDTFSGNVRLHGGPAPTSKIEVFVLGREEVDTIESGEDYTLFLPAGKHNFYIRPIDTVNYNHEKYNGYTSEMYISHINILAKDPISLNSSCDSLILFQYLLINGMFDDYVSHDPDYPPKKNITPEVTDSIFKLYSDYQQGERVTYVNIENHKAYAFQRICFGLSKLKFLRFSNCGLTSLSEKIGILDELDTLSLRYNNLTSLPESITQLEDLKYLNLMQNNIESLPEPIKSWADARDPDWATTQKE